MATTGVVDTRAEPSPHRGSRAPAHRRRHRRRWRALLLAVVLLAGGVTLTGTALSAVRTEMTAVHDGVLRGTAALAAGDAETAAAAFERASERATTADMRLSTPSVRVAGLLPGARQQVRTTRALVSAGGLVAQAGGEVAAALLGLDGGVAAIVPSDGRFPVAPLRSVHPRLRRAADLAGQAQHLVRAADHRLLLPQLRGARAAALDDLEPAAESLSVAAALADGLPGFLGADGQRRYLFGAATPAELRGTGGLIGAYAPMTARDGAVSFGRFVPASQLPAAVDDPPPAPSQDYHRRYRQFAAAGHWSNVNMTPDFPTAAVAIERLYGRATGEQVDGTVVADPFALQLLLEATGPVDVAGVGTIGPETVVDFLTHGSYVELPDPDSRKSVLGRVAVAVFERFLRSDAPPQHRARLLAEAVAGGHVLLHARDDEVQDALVRARVAGHVIQTGDDYVAVVANNAAGNKIDYFSERALDYRVDLRPDGAAHGRLEVGLTNTAPSEGLPTYVIGPSDGRFAPGENVTILATYCAITCRSEGLQVDGEPADIGQQEELGRPVLPVTVRVPSGATRTVTHDWQVLRGWDASDAGGIYRLTLQGQTTVRPTRAAVRVAVPDGMEVTRVSEGARVNGDVVTWRGVLGNVVRIEVAFTRRHAGWQALQGLFGEPPR